ncbi:MAG: hypothetical protein WCC64_18715 [Aliidongia sp.]
MINFSSKVKLLVCAASLSLWLAPTLQRPAFAEVVLPSDFISPDVPHDVPTGANASIQDVAIFAWREFIALNWVARDPAVTGLRGRPDVNADFLTVRPDKDGSFPLLVWQTYQHKNELFPPDGKTNPSFDSPTPHYAYKSKAITAADSGADFTLFNNLDETSEINLCNMFAHDTIRIAYEAKVNRAIFEYANNNKLTDCNDKGICATLVAARDKTSGMKSDKTSNLVDFGGICSEDPTIVSLPCGNAGIHGDAGEGAIEIKAAWRQLTPQEARSGRFYMRKVIFYTGQQYMAQKYHNAVYGLVALHIIHKTQSFPDFVFATWEQVDDYNDVTNSNTQGLKFVNIDTTIKNIPVKRAHGIHPEILPVNEAVHQIFKIKSPTTVWQYYKLIGVQATPVNGPPMIAPSPAALATRESYYYLANIVVETNEALQNFFGKIENSSTAPFQNLYLHGAQGSPFQMGGCQGCHGTQAQAFGGDMSRLIAAAPANSNQAPESIDATGAMAAKSYQNRSANVTSR